MTPLIVFCSGSCGGGLWRALEDPRYSESNGIANPATTPTADGPALCCSHYFVKSLDALGLVFRAQRG